VMPLLFQRVHRFLVESTKPQKRSQEVRLLDLLVGEIQLFERKENYLEGAAAAVKSLNPPKPYSPMTLPLDSS